MSMTRKGFSALLLSLLLLLLCFPAAVFGEDAVNAQEIFVTNTPIKGKIVLEKTGMVLTGFVESTDSTGNVFYTPDYHEGHVSGAVYEIKAVEDIVGKEGTKWFSAGETAAVITTTAEGSDESPLLPLGHYYITEKSAPDGYALDENRYDVLLQAADQKTPVVVETINVTDEFLPTRITFRKEAEIIVTKDAGKGLVTSELQNIPGQDFIFGLYTRDEIIYPDGSLPANTLVAVTRTDENGKGTFSGNFPHGGYYLKEISAPDGWKVNTTAFDIHLSRGSLNSEGIVEVNWEVPIHDEIIHADIKISKTDLTGTDYLPNTLIEIRNEDDEIVCKAYTGDDGYVPAFPALHGNYTYREVLAPEGYELSVTELKFTVDENGVVTEKTSVADDYTRFSVLKVDENTKPLAGVEFGLYDEKETLKMTAITDENGIATFEKVPYGNYFIQEKQPLPGYQRDYTRVPVSVDGTFVNPKAPLAIINNCPMEILLKKVDQDGNILAGAEFGLYNDAGKLVMTTTADKDGLIRFTHVENGTYTVREMTAPDGYLMSRKSITVTVNDEYTNPEAPTGMFVNVRKLINLKKVDTSGKPMAGVEFELINATTGEVAETAVSKKDGTFAFTHFDYGDWIIRETEAPDGFCKMQDITITVNDEWTVPEEIQCVNIPNHYEFLKVDSSGNPMAGVKFRLENAEGKDLGSYVSDKDGIVRIAGLERGTYYVKETETLEGFSVTGEVIKIVLDEKYTIPEAMPKLVNYTVIQTGVRIAVTGVMILGFVLMAVSGTLFVIRRRKAAAQEG